MVIRLDTTTWAIGKGDTKRRGVWWKKGWVDMEEVWGADWVL
jgi:hypothetical protein